MVDKFVQDSITKNKTCINEQEIQSTNLLIVNEKLKLENNNNLNFLDEKLIEIDSLKVSIESLQCLV